MHRTRLVLVPAAAILALVVLGALVLRTAPARAWLWDVTGEESGWEGVKGVVAAALKVHPKFNASVDLAGRKVYARVWLIQVGRVSLYLLDSNVSENSESDRLLTARLYSNDPEVRISQEILLGMGGVRALRLLVDDGQLPRACLDEALRRYAVALQPVPPWSR